ncbi:hypothetical protein [Marivirga sp.]|uniref:hypothetical protein n=1 Tax=Marivirga sp. TaxID=2018662 RepID=UPI003DA743E7
MKNLIFLFLLFSSVTQAQSIVVGPEARGIDVNNILDYDDGEAYSGESEDILNYLEQLGIEYNNEKYIILYPWGNDAYSDHHFTQFLTAEYDYRDLIFIFIYTNPFIKLNIEDIISKQNKYLYLDNDNLYRHQQFYNYTPVVIQFHENKVFQKWHMSFKHALPIKRDIFVELK